MLRFKKAHGALWELIFFHNVTEGTNLYFDDSSALNNNEENKFSIIGFINEAFRINGCYEYLLEYPEHGEYLIWQQTIHISNTTAQQTAADIGYKKKHQNYEGFKGLSRSTNSHATVFDGSPGTDGFYFSIGAKCEFAYSNRFAGVPLNAEYPTRICYLWIRVPPKFLLSRCTNNQYLHKSMLLYAILTFK